MNAFFASGSQQQMRPELRGRPVAVVPTEDRPDLLHRRQLRGAGVGSEDRHQRRPGPAAVPGPGARERSARGLRPDPSPDPRRGRDGAADPQGLLGRRDGLPARAARPARAASATGGGAREAGDRPRRRALPAVLDRIGAQPLSGEGREQPAETRRAVGHHTRGAAAPAAPARPGRPARHRSEHAAAARKPRRAEHAAALCVVA